MPLFRHKPLSEGERYVILHCFGGTYGPAKFLLTAAEQAMIGTIHITLMNKWGSPIASIPIESEITLEDGPFPPPLKTKDEWLAEGQALAPSSGTEKPLPLTIKPSTLMPAMPRPTRAKVLLLSTSSGMRKLLSPVTKPFSLIPAMPLPTTTRAVPLRDLERNVMRNKRAKERDNFAIVAKKRAIGLLMCF